MILHKEKTPAKVFINAGAADISYFLVSDTTSVNKFSVSRQRSVNKFYFTFNNVMKIMLNDTLPTNPQHSRSDFIQILFLRSNQSCTVDFSSSPWQKIPLSRSFLDLQTVIAICRQYVEHMALTHYCLLGSLKKDHRDMRFGDDDKLKSTVQDWFDRNNFFFCISNIRIPHDHL